MKSRVESNKASGSYHRLVSIYIIRETSRKEGLLLPSYYNQPTTAFPLLHTNTAEKERKKERKKMENGGEVLNKEEGASYTYWVREVSGDAAPLPLPRKLSPQDVLNGHSHPNTTLGSVWNKAGTWEEKNLSKWATDRIKELLVSVGSLEFFNGKAEIAEVSKCFGDAFLVTVRNKKRVGYTYELTLKVKGEWIIKEEKKTVKGHIDIAEFSYGELDDLQVEVTINDDKDLSQQDKAQIREDLKLFLEPVRGKLLQFELELKDR